jgi:hypothetical protein
LTIKEEEEEAPFTLLKTLSKDANHCLEQIRKKKKAKKHTLMPILKEIKKALKPKALNNAEKTADGPASAKKPTKGEDPSQKKKRKTVG